MEFLTDYGLFLAKAITFIIAFGAIVVIIIAASSKGDKQSDGHVVIKKLNDKFDDVIDIMNDTILDDDALKEIKKQEKKKLKDESKEKKKLAKLNKSKSKDVADSNTEAAKADKTKRVFIASFDGDIKASEADQLREVITSILSVANEQDEVVVKLESPGGMVHSYGFAASQLARVTEKNIPLTVCVDKVAASGGYMMACVANKIIAAPFAVIGSIGVVAQIPNFHKLLKKNDIDYETLTAGEYKRTMTVFGENTDKGRQKFIEDLEQTHDLFKQFITQHRPVVDIEKVATGEIWFGLKALDEKLIDEVQTSDAYIFSKRADADLFEVGYVKKQPLMEKLGIGVESSIERAFIKIWQTANNRFF